jgi:predicted outer membrane repeat protein
MRSKLAFWLMCVIVMLSGSIVRAQEARVLQVQPGSTVVDATDVICPTPRDSGVYMRVTAAVMCAEPGDTIALAEGTYSGTISLSKSLTIQGSGTFTTILDGQSQGTVIVVEDGVAAVLENLSIVNGVAVTGGGVYSQAGTVILENVQISNNTALRAGGGIYSENATFNLIESLIVGNQIRPPRIDEAIDLQGAGIFAAAGQVTISGGIVSGNLINGDGCFQGSVNARGAGIYIESSAVVLTGTTISGNTLQVTPCSSSDTVQMAGSGIYNAAGTISVIDGQLSDTIAGGDSAQFIGIEPGNQIEGIATSTSVSTLNAPQATTVPTGNATSPDSQIGSDPEPAVAWMTAILKAVQQERLSPPVAARIYAYAGVTLYEATMTGQPDYRSLAGQLNGLDELPTPDSTLTYDRVTIANTALRQVTGYLFASGSEAIQASFDQVQSEIELLRGDIVPVNTFLRSQAYGMTLASAIIDWADGDNYGTSQQLVYSLPDPSDNDSLWTPLNGQLPLQPFWGVLRPFTLTSAAQCDVEPTIDFSADPASTFYLQAQEVYATSQSLTEEERAKAFFWADAPGQTATPAGHWVSIANQLVSQLDLSLDQTVDMYARLGVSMGDSFIAAWNLKYRINLLRPVQYIERYIDPTWEPIISTPPFPEYPSGHSVVSGASAVILTQLYGDVALVDRTHLERQLLPRTFPTFDAMAEEAAMSRLYGGIHYAMSIENGLEQGRCIGQHVNNRLITHLDT